MRTIPRLHLILFILTLFSTMIVGARHEGADLLKDPVKLYMGIPFSITLLLILLTHEISHYLASKMHGVDATLPYFLPAPTLFGTLGAFIKMKSPVTTRSALIDIGAAGPIAGFVVSCIAVVVGLFLSNEPARIDPNDEYLYGTSLLFFFFAKLILGAFITGKEFAVHSVAFAGWIGFFVTSMNLIPVGQLDGGHIAYALIGEKHVTLSKVLIGIMIILGILFWFGWIIWAVLLIILGLRHPPILYHGVPLDNKRKIIGFISFIIFILTFTPVPIVIR